jgi:YesN/AraC family two-component response regulator
MEFLQPYDKIFSLLYVEDEPLARELLHKVISRKFPAIKIHTAEDGKVGLEVFKRINPEIVLSDIDLPTLNGILMVSEIRNLNPNTEIIIVSGQVKTSNESAFVNIGISDYLEKPIRHEVLFGAIEDSLARITTSQKKQGRTLAKMKVADY